MFALLAMEWTQNTKDATDKTGFKCKEEVQAYWLVTRFSTALFGPEFETTMSKQIRSKNALQSKEEHTQFCLVSPVHDFAVVTEMMQCMEVSTDGDEMLN